MGVSRLASLVLHVFAMVTTAVTSGGSRPAAPTGPHPLVGMTSCHALGPQAIMESLRQHVVAVNRDQLEKYTAILKYMRQAPDALNTYLSGENIAEQHDRALAQLEEALWHRLQLVQLDVLLPWARLHQLRLLSDTPGRLRSAARHSLRTGLLLVLNETKKTEDNIIDNISGLVQQYRLLFINYKAMLEVWVDDAWSQDSAAQKRDTLLEMCELEFPAMIAKPLMYLLEDENQEFYHDFPTGYDDIFTILRDLRSAMKSIKSLSDVDESWKLLLSLIPKGGSSPEEEDEDGSAKQAQLEMEEEVLSTHLVNMLTGYPDKGQK